MNTNTTNKHSLRVLSKTFIGKLENKKFIEFNAEQRGQLVDDLNKYLSKSVLTEEDINEMTRADVAKVTDTLTDANVTESDAYKSQKKALKTQFGDNAMSGFYLKQPLRNLVIGVGKFLFDHELVEEVFETDENIHRLLMETFQNFDESKIS